MPILVIPGGQAEIRAKVTVGGQQLLQEVGTDLFGYVKRNYPEAKTLSDIHVGEMTGEFSHLIHLWQRAGVVALLKSWSLPEPLPTMQTIDEMDPDVYSEITAVTTKLAFKAMEGIDLELAVREDGTIDRENPTQTSSGSEPPSEAATTPSTDQALHSSDDSVSTATDESSPV
jgi:hypothetical protein